MVGWVDLNHRPRPCQERDLGKMFAAIIGVCGSDRLTSSAYVFEAAVVFLRPFKAAHDQD